VALASDATVGVDADGGCTCTGIWREDSVPVINADSTTVADVTVAMGSRTASVLLSIKLITATAAIMAPAAVKILILRITLSFNRKFCGV
jgi:hypothetical protein